MCLCLQNHLTQDKDEKQCGGEVKGQSLKRVQLGIQKEKRIFFFLHYIILDS